MATSYKDLAKSLSPTAFRQPFGAQWLKAAGDQKDDLVDQVKQAVKLRFPLLAPDDALAQIGAERGMPRGPSESTVAYALRVQEAWTAWKWVGTPYGILSQLSALGYTRVLIEQIRGDGTQGTEFTLDANGALVVNRLPAGSWLIDFTGLWNEFDVIILTDAMAGGGEPHPSDTSDEVTRIRQIISAWKPAHAKCAHLVWWNPGDGTALWGYASFYAANGHPTWLQRSSFGATWGSYTLNWQPTYYTPPT